MQAPHRLSPPSRTSSDAAPPSPLNRGGLLLLVLLGALLAGCGPQATAPGTTAAGVAADSERFVFVRARMGIVRVDTSTGQVWTVPLNGDGGWAPRGAAPDLAGEPARNGRFQVMAIVTPRNAARIGNVPDPPVLMRVDRATGRSWLLEAEDAQSWLAVGESGQSPVAEPEAPGVPAPTTPTASAGSRALDESTTDSYPILTGDQLGVTPEEKQKTIQTLRTARTKQELPQKMRVWAVRQLGEVDPDLAVPELLEVLRDPDPVLVVAAIEQLGRIGRASTIPEILKLRDHPDASVRAAVSTVVVEVE